MPYVGEQHAHTWYPENRKEENSELDEYEGVLGGCKWGTLP